MLDCRLPDRLIINAALQQVRTVGGCDLLGDPCTSPPVPVCAHEYAHVCVCVCEWKSAM